MDSLLTSVVVSIVTIILFVGNFLFVQRIAHRKGLDPVIWGLLGFLCPGPALIGVLIAGPKLRTCAECGEAFVAATGFCPTCQIPLSPPGSDRFGPDNPPDGRCEQCGHPFVYADYRRNAPYLLCIECDAELPKPEVTPQAWQDA